jgi:hypothetical protein
MTENDRAELYRLEQLLALAGKRPTRDELKRYIADDFFEHGASGKIWTKETVIDAIQSWPSVERTVVDFCVRALSDTVVLVTYKSTCQAEHAGMQPTSLRASIWRKNGKSWEVVFHQGTPLQPARRSVRRRDSRRASHRRRD